MGSAIAVGQVDNDSKRPRRFGLRASTWTSEEERDKRSGALDKTSRQV